MKKFLNWRKLLKSIKFACQGLIFALKEQSFRFLLLLCFLLIILMFILETSIQEKMILILIISVILSFELLNSQIERILDILHPQYDPKVKEIKDICAGAVLVVCFAALLISVLMFFPFLLKLLAL
ncbi:hypothetical protein AMJ49_05660 [Parcubacteria bacterium DG_74_2]|nr:MAG: hypothetical protein AMJ49_05660 [Parcubacteria bacterium DG_74_2]